MHGSKFLGASVHDFRKRLHAARIISRQTSRNVIGTFHQQCPKEIDALISVACLNVQLHWVGHCIYRLDSDCPVQKTALRYNESCQQFLRARCRSYLVRVFFVQYFSAVCVDHDHRRGAGFRYSLGSELGRRGNCVFSVLFDLCAFPVRRSMT